MHRKPEELIKVMETVREICRIGHSLRRDVNIPVSYPLYAVELDTIFLWSDELELIRKELNCLTINPFITRKDPEETWVGYTSVTNPIGIALRVDRTSDLQAMYDSNKKRREDLLSK